MNEEVLDMLEKLVVYQYGSESSRIFSEIDRNLLRVCYSKNTKRMRCILYDGGRIFATIRASDYMIVPHIIFARYLHKVLPYPRYRVVVLNEFVEDILNSYTVFSRHIISGDPRIKPYDEVMIVDENDSLIGVGRALLDYESMITATRGAAVQIREKYSEGCTT
ncbi:MAG: PUA domain-containing protein [Ignisphaera sp.]